MSVLVIADHDGNEIKKSTLSTIAAAQQLHSDVDVLVAGKDCGPAAEAAKSVSGVRKVIHADSAALAYLMAENTADLVVSMADAYTAILMSASTSGKNILPRVAALLDTQAISDIISVESADTFKRPIYAGNVIATVKSNDETKVLTVRATAFDPVQATGGAAEIETIDAKELGLSEFDKEELAKSDRPELTAASIIVSGGRGIGSEEKFSVVYDLADKLGAAVGASRAAVDAGYVPNDMQVGQTGKIVAPDLYIAAGISGAIQHLAGMKDSKVIVAINKDEDAPIFQVADYGLVADLFEALPEMASKV